MQKEDVIKLRDTLKGKDNLPLMIYVDNNFNLFNEADYNKFTIWDDKNGILYSFQFVNHINDVNPSDAGKEIAVYSTTYEHIQAMEITNLKINSIGDLIDRIKDSGRNISDDFKKKIIDTFDKLLDPNMATLSREYINNIVGSSLDTQADYYNGKFPTSRQETSRYKELNKFIEEQKKNNNKE